MAVLRPDQLDAVAKCRSWLATAKRGDALFLTSPTGSGKSYVQLAVAQEHCLPIVTPSPDNAEAYREKGRTLLGFEPQVWTPITLRNRLWEGAITEAPRALILDEGHHAKAESWQQMRMALGSPPVILFSATGFRGTPRDTVELHRLYGTPHPILTYPDAVRQGTISMPSCHTVPLVDDDAVEIRDGEFVVRSIESATSDRMEDMVGLLARYYTGERYAKPVLVSLPSTALVEQWCALAEARDLPCVSVTQGTSRLGRRGAFARCLRCEAATVQIRVAGEGVDVAWQVLIDGYPTLSPVQWLQQFGRITRPGLQPEYLCTNRNLMRHYYLLAGCLPPATYKATQDAWGGPSKRIDTRRALGLESLGRLRPTTVLATDGTAITYYAISAVEGTTRRDYAVICDPRKPEVLWATRENAEQWGQWVACPQPTELSGFASLRPSPLTPKQSQWWERAAERRGLDPTQEVNARVFSILPVLTNIGGKL